MKTNEILNDVFLIYQVAEIAAAPKETHVRVEQAFNRIKEALKEPEKKESEND